MSEERMSRCRHLVGKRPQILAALPTAEMMVFAELNTRELLNAFEDDGGKRSDIPKLVQYCYLMGFQHGCTPAEETEPK